MRKLVFVALVVVLTLTLSSPAWAADDGNTQFKLSSATLYYPNDAYYAVNTSGTGNIKAIRCSGIGTSQFTVQIKINGGTTQSFGNFGDQGADSGWVPMNLRFTSSVSVELVNGTQYQSNGLTCTVSWGLD
jgi:hypothetical protein